MKVLESYNLSGKVAVVTGAGTGIGGGIAQGLVEAGASLFATYNTHYPTELEALAKENGVGFAAMQLDLYDKANWAKVVDEPVKAFGRLDILVNNAGTCLRSPAIEHSEEYWDAVIQLNEKALFFISQKAAQQFVKQGSRGKIINIASMLSYLGGFNCASYVASKHAVMGLTRVMASEWAQKGINVNALAPGWIRTNLSEALQKDPERNAAILARIPMGDWGVPEDFKGVAVFLASDASNYVTGVTIPVDGGYLVK